MSTENRDIIIAGGVLVLLGVLYFTIRPKPVIQSAPESNPAEQTYNGPPSYNMPPILTLPPYNTGNAPPAQINSSKPNDNCGCNACKNKSGNAITSYPNMVAFWNQPDSGITMPAVMTAPSLPNVTNAIQTVPAMSFQNWQISEGLNRAANLDQTSNAAAFNPLADPVPLYVQQTTKIAGWDILINDERKQHAVYNALNGNLYNMATPAQKTAADAIIFA